MPPNHPPPLADQATSLPAQERSTRTHQSGQSTAEHVVPASAGPPRSAVADSSDPELVAAHLGGDGSAFTELVRRHRWSVFLTCLRVLENHQDAEDQAQCVFEKALYAMSSYRGECEIGAWLRTIAENMSYNARRARRSRRANESRASAAGDGGDLPDPRAQDPEHAAVSRLAFEQALDAIPEPHQHTFRLVYLAGLSKAEAAEVEQISVGTVGSRCFRAKKALAGYLRETENL